MLMLNRSAKLYKVLFLKGVIEYHDIAVLRAPVA